MAHAGDAELIELVVAADAGERDAIVDLAHLAQGVGLVLRADHDAVLHAERGQGPASGDPLRAKSARSFMSCSGAT